MSEPRRAEGRTDAGIPAQPVYRPEDVADLDYQRDLGDPGAFPYARGVYGSMYRGRLWTMRQYAGFASAEESNRRYKYLLEQGQTGLSVAFDLPTQMGYDSDAPVASGEVGKVGVAIDSVEDMRALFDGIPLDRVSTSMTINAPASILLLLYELVGEEQGVDPAELRGTIQNDVLKEYIARGTYIFPPQPSLRIITDTFGYCAERLPSFNTISISGYHIAEAGATAVQEVAFTLSDAIAYVEAALEAGLDVDQFAPRLSFFFVARSSLLEEVAKFRAARRLWARLMHDRFGARDPKSQMLRFHTQTAGVQLTAQQAEVNLVRVTLQSLAATLGGTQSLHANAFDEALSLPSEKAARLALRTQQVLAHETDVPLTADPLGGSWFVESLTDEIEAQVADYLARIDERGGAVVAIEQGYQKGEIERSAFDLSRQIEQGERVVVGVNRYRADEEVDPELQRVDEAVRQQQVERLDRVRRQRDQAAVDAALADVAKAAEGEANLLPVMKHALRERATVGEVCDALRGVFGEYVPPDTF
ncbi:methylmalonyl-CoA mutase [Egibacter rhizosphaerae]|uniref:Methylmalonyl-CoA mutase n=1 Tax=Egibacter rhizosphaerae TaxID=1670831 RepID=A0A411YHU4_9ACTN|nr:methylmalonyl-CoA mutase family protein [Egibacter rhizosphaerae]QBI20642.1 methylmalonyl-CoA mutase [Egibacter rhizosphaerae]